MSQPPELISVIVPAYNEEKNVAALYDALQPVLARLPFDHEIIFVDDGSRDGTAEVLRRLEARDDKVRVIELSRNFGKEAATTAGLNQCRGRACLMIDADLQHPVELIPEFIRKWQAGAEVVVGVRDNEAGGGLFRKIGTAAYYRLMSLISDTPVVPRSTDYRLLDRIVVDEFNRFTERSRMTRALIDWLGFRRDYVRFAARPRPDGRGRYGAFKLIKLALSSFVAHSLLPLKIAGYLGMTITCCSGLLGLFILVEKYFLGDPGHFNFSGPAILAVINLFLAGITLSCLGLIALYIANIHGEVANRPLYVVRNRKPGSR